MNIRKGKFHSRNWISYCGIFIKAWNSQLLPLLSAFPPQGSAQWIFLLRHLHSPLTPSNTLPSPTAPGSPAWQLHPHHPSTVPPLDRSAPSQSALSGFTPKTSGMCRPLDELLPDSVHPRYSQRRSSASNTPSSPRSHSLHRSGRLTWKTSPLH